MLQTDGTAVLVTGAAGYVGSVCCELFLQKQYRVIALDNLSEGHRAAVHPAAMFVLGDIHDKHQVEDLFSSHKIGAVMHFAATAKIDESNPGQFFGNNVCALHTLLEAMIQHGIQNLVLSSSASVYGEPASIPISEEQTKAPLNSYGESKLMCERMLHWYHQSYGINYIALRYFNAAGASEHYGEDHRQEHHVIPLLLRAGAGESPHFTIYGDNYPTKDGTCIRDFVHVVDIAEAHILALQAIRERPLPCRAYNIGNGTGYSVREVIGCAEKIAGRQIPIRVGPRRAGDPAILVADSSRIWKDLGWRPRWSDLERIISSAWQWRNKHPTGYSNRTGRSTPSSGGQ